MNTDYSLEEVGQHFSVISDKPVRLARRCSICGNDSCKATYLLESAVLSLSDNGRFVTGLMDVAVTS
jgi:hypothetical protein